MSIEAMKQALEALEYFKELALSMGEIERAEKTITTLRTAIEQAEKSNIKQVIHLYDKPPAAPMQEPPPECQTEAEKRAYAFGWWKAMEHMKQNP
jgi:hypothetical protein